MSPAATDTAIAVEAAATETSPADTPPAADAPLDAVADAVLAEDADASLVADLDAALVADVDASLPAELPSDTTVAAADGGSPELPAEVADSADSPGDAAAAETDAALAADLAIEASAADTFIDPLADAVPFEDAGPWTPPAGLLASPPIQCPVPNVVSLPGVFTELGQPAGIDAQTPQFFPAGSPFAGFEVREGGGIALADFDGDGRIDVYAVSPTGPDRLHLADPQIAWQFKGYSVDTGGSLETGALAADFDGDGDPDLIVCGDGVHVLRNDGPSAAKGVELVDITKAVGLDGTKGTPYFGASASDVDRDGWLDVLLVALKWEKPDGSDSFPPPLFAHKLLRNKGNWQFEDASDVLPKAKRPCYIGSWFDADNDGDDDLYLVNDFGSMFGANQMLRNDTAGPGKPFVLKDVSVQAAADIADNGMGAAIGDFDRDGWFDVYLTGTEGGNYLLHNMAKAISFGDATLDSSSGNNGSEYLSWGAVFFDADSDGWLDLYVANGYLKPTLKGPPPNVQGSKLLMFSPTMPKKQKDNFYLAQGNQTFIDFAVPHGLGFDGQSRGVAWADLDRDGFADLAVGPVFGRPQVYRNGCDGRGWLHVSLKNQGGNRLGIGARVTVKAGSAVLVREIDAGSAGLWSTSEAAALFGLGAAKQADSLQVKWPDGVVQEFGAIPVHRRVTVVHP